MSREGRSGYVERREAGDGGKKAKLRGLYFSLCPSMTASPTATSPATATCLAPKVGSPTPDLGLKYGMWICGDVWTTSHVVRHPGPLPIPPSPQPSVPHPQGPW